MGRSLQGFYSVGKDGFFYQEAMGKDEKIRRICMQLVEMMVVMGKDRMMGIHVVIETD